MQGKLYLVATPIGNLEDITLRALKVLEKVDIVAAEDTRNTLKLLNHFGLSKKLITYHRHNEEIKKDELINYMKNGKSIALVSDAGTPCISDPGEEIVKEAIKEEIEIVPIPGACALITALITSGLECKEFCFIGFLPLNKKNRKEKLQEIRQERKTIILYEAPHKLKNTLEDLKDILKDRQIVLAKELSKIHESYKRGTADDLLKGLEQEIKGEFVIVIEGEKEQVIPTNEEILNELTLEKHYEYYENKGLEKKDIIKRIAKDRNVTKNEIYKYFIKNK